MRRDAAEKSLNLYDGDIGWVEFAKYMEGRVTIWCES